MYHIVYYLPTGWLVGWLVGWMENGGWRMGLRPA